MTGDVFVIAEKMPTRPLPKVSVKVLASNRVSAGALFLFAFECTIFVGECFTLSKFNESSYNIKR